MIRRAQKLFRILTRGLYRKALLLYRVPATSEHDSILSNVGKGITYVIDIGANRGQFALAARSSFPKAKIISFEPLVEAQKVFSKVFKDDPNVLMIPFALGKTEGSTKMHVALADHSSSLLPISTSLTTLFPIAEEKECRDVQVFSLSHFIKNEEIPENSLLKMDVQGYELEVLEGCESLINKFKFCYIECSFIELYVGQALAHQVISWCEKHNFRLTGIYDLYYDKTGKAIQGDFFFSNLNQQ